MDTLRNWIILSWIALPTVMFGGYSLLRLLNRGNVLTPFKVQWFRAGHAHAGVLLLMSLLYFHFLDQTVLSASLKQIGCLLVFLGILAQSGGFFLHMMLGAPNQSSSGTTVTIAGALMLASAVGILVYGLILTK